MQQTTTVVLGVYAVEGVHKLTRKDGVPPKVDAALAVATFGLSAYAALH